MNHTGKDPIWCVKQGTGLWYQTAGSVQLLRVCFKGCMFISFCEVKEHVSSRWRLLSRPYNSSSSVAPTWSACPLLFCTLHLFYVQSEKNILITNRTCLFNVHSMSYMFFSPYDLFKRKKKRKTR